MTERKSIRKHPLYRILLWVALAASLVVLWKMNASVLSNPLYIPVDDFSHYWSAGKLAISGENPYDPAAVNQLKNQITGSQLQYDTTPIMYTPPWSLPVVMPFGLFGYPTARLFWLMAHVTLLMLCANWLWKIYQGNSKMVFVAWGIAFIFGPTISVLEKGQITPWVLAGIVGFLYFTEYRQNDLLAGIMVLFIALKPQLFYLFWPAFLFWAIFERKWKLLAGAAIAVILALSIPFIFNPLVISQYIQALLYYPPADWATPTIGGYLRLLLGVDKFWLQFIPTALGLIWFIYYWNKYKQQWSWSKTLPTLLLVSILSAPYAWTYDQVILLPAMLAAGIRLMKDPRDRRIIFFGLAFLLISLLDLFLHRVWDEFWFGWLAPALLIWYYAVMHYFPEKENPINPVAENEPD